MPSGTVACSPSRCASTERPAPPGLVDEEVVERLVELRPAEEPGRAGDELDLRIGEVGLPHALDPGAVVDRLRVTARLLLEPAEAGWRDGLDLTQQVVDRLVARRGDAHALAGREQAGNEARSRPRLARAGRPLHEQVAALDLARQSLHLVERLALDAGAAERRLAPQQPLEVRVAAEVACEPDERRLLRLRAHRSAGHDGLGQRNVLEARPTPERQGAGGVVERDDRAGAPPGARVGHVVARRELVLLRRERKAVVDRLRAAADLDGRPVR
jgi:hypothetical protein